MLKIEARNWQISREKPTRKYPAPSTPLPPYPYTAQQNQYTSDLTTQLCMCVCVCECVRAIVRKFGKFVAVAVTSRVELSRLLAFCLPGAAQAGAHTPSHTLAHTQHTHSHTHTHSLSYTLDMLVVLCI